MEEPAIPQRNGGEEQPKDREAREADGTDGTSEATLHPRSPADKHKFHTLGHQRRTKQKVVTDFTTLSKGTSAGVKPRAALKQVLFNQAEKNSPTEERGQLDLLKQALQGYAVPVDLTWKWKEELHGSSLEKSWKDLVHSHPTMSKMQRHQQEALWEFVHTELTYINRIIIVTELVIAALVHLHQRGFLQEVKQQKLFSNLPDVLKAHQLFWQEVIFPMLQEVRTTGKPFDPMKLEAGCLQFHQRFSAYQLYCWEEEENLEFARQLTETNLHFGTYVKWVETHPQCSRMRLGDMQAKPHQRITKYPLLLKAVLKNTQDPLIQHRLKGMWSSVNTFLESINEYLRQKDEELALHISALRMEGYEMEGINEEIDKHVRELCRFDLTCPIKGVGRGVVRKLLLEENLKVRGRKDSKLEVVALLFSDVLLVTKVQKKGEKLKVVRPPLPLDRTFCVALKDTVSFILVEVGELQCAMNVYIFTAGTADRCSTWVAMVKNAKDHLRSLRELETKRRHELWRVQTQEDKPATLEEIHGTEDQDPPSSQRAGATISELAGPQNQSLQEEITNDPPFWQSKPQQRQHKVSRLSVVGRQQAVLGYEWIEMGVRSPEPAEVTDEDETVFPLSNKGTQRTQRARSVPHVGANAAGRLLRAGQHSLIPGGYPDVDYPTDTPPSDPDQTTRNGFEFGRGATSTSSSSTVRSSTSVGDPPVAEAEAPTKAGTTSSDLRSPRLRRRRPLTAHHGLPSQAPKTVPRRSGPAWSASSNSDSDSTSKKTAISDARKVLKLGSLKSNQGMFWNMYESRERAEPQIFSDTELPHVKNTKRHKLKPVRRSSISNMTTQEEAPTTSNLQRFLQAPNPNGHSSPLEGLLKRAKARQGDTSRRDRISSARPPASPNLSTTPSPLASDVDRDTEWEDQVEVTRHRVLTVSKGWREQLVDGDDEEDERNSLLYSSGVNVDWSGWCFDDDEVMDQLQPSGQGLLEGITQSLTFWDLHYVSEQEEGEYSQV